MNEEVSLADDTMLAVAADCSRDSDVKKPQTVPLSRLVPDVLIQHNTDVIFSV
jgi:hypothetical protein